MKQLLILICVFGIFNLSSCKTSVASSQSFIVKNLGEDKIISNYADSVSIHPAQICNKFNVPATLSELNQNEIFSSNITVNIGASLSAFGFSGSMSKKDVLVAAYLIAFKDYTCDNNTTMRALVGIRLYVHATDLKINFTSPTLPQVAAAVQLGMAKAEYRLQIIGINAGNIYTQLPSASFDVDTYSKVISSYDNIIHSLTGTTVIDPLINVVTNGQMMMAK